MSASSAAEPAVTQVQTTVINTDTADTADTADTEDDDNSSSSIVGKSEDEPEWHRQPEVTKRQQCEVLFYEAGQALLTLIHGVEIDEDAEEKDDDEWQEFWEEAFQEAKNTIRAALEALVGQPLEYRHSDAITDYIFLLQEYAQSRPKQA